MDTAETLANDLVEKHSEEIAGLNRMIRRYKDDRRKILEAFGLPATFLGPIPKILNEIQQLKESQSAQRIEELEKERDFHLQAFTKMERRFRDLEAQFAAVRLAANCPMDKALIEHVGEMWIETSLAAEEIQGPCTTEDRAILLGKDLDEFKEEIREDIKYLKVARTSGDDLSLKNNGYIHGIINRVKELERDEEFIDKVTELEKKLKDHLTSFNPESNENLRGKFAAVDNRIDEFKKATRAYVSELEKKLDAHEAEGKEWSESIANLVEALRSKINNH